MADSVYRVTQVIGSSSESWEAAARQAVETAAQTVRDLRVAEVVRQDVTIENGKISAYRVRLDLSFKYEGAAELDDARVRWRTGLPVAGVARRPGSPRGLCAVPVARGDDVAGRPSGRRHSVANACSLPAQHPRIRRAHPRGSRA